MLAVILLGSMLAIGATFLPSATAGLNSGSSSAVRELGAPETATCAAITSNASLNQTYISMYQNSSGSTNSSYPNVSVGEQQLHDAWVSVCESGPFRTLYQQVISNPSAKGSLSSGLGQNGTTGEYEAVFGFTYFASCSNPSDFSSSGCEYVTNWYVDLGTGSITGPVTIAETPLGSSPGTNGTAPSHGGGSGVPPVLGLPGVDGYAVLVVAAAIVGSLVAVRLRTRGRETIPPEGSSPPSDRPTPRAAESASPGTLPRLAIPQPATARLSEDPLGDVY
jgi:hypothetical protein